MLQRPWQNIGPPSSPSSKKRSGSKRCGWPMWRQTNQALAPSQHSGPANSDRLTLFVKAQLCEIPPCRCVRAPESRLPKASPPRSWRASLILKHAKVLGEVEAPSREAADAPAVQTFNLNRGQRRSAAEESARENMPIKWSLPASRRQMTAGVIILACASFLAGAEAIDLIQGRGGPFGLIIMVLFALALLLGLIIEIRSKYPRKGAP